MLKRIVAALDGSPASNAALREAVQWSSRLGAELWGVYVEDEHRLFYVPPYTQVESGVAVTVPLPEEEYTAMEQKMRKEGEEIKALFERQIAIRNGFKKTFITKRADVNAFLIAQARASDLVVMGSKGSWNGTRPHKTGPTTETLIDQALRPVLVVPDEGNTEGPVLFAYDGSKSAERVAVPGAFLSALSGAPCAILTCHKDTATAERTQDSLVRYLSAYGLDARKITSHERASTAILETAKELRAGMIVMGAFGHSTIRELIFGSTTLDVLADAPCPVLMMA